jgi:hypothetical protein
VWHQGAFAVRPPLQDDMNLMRQLRTIRQTSPFGKAQGASVPAPCVSSAPVRDTSDLPARIPQPRKVLKPCPPGWMADSYLSHHAQSSVSATTSKEMDVAHPTMLLPTTSVPSVAQRDMAPHHDSAYEVMDWVITPLCPEGFETLLPSPPSSLYCLNT